MIDHELGVKYCIGKEDFYMEVLQDFADETEEKIEEILAAVKKRKWQDYLRIVHTYKGNAMMIGAVEFSELSRMHQDAVREKNIDFVKANYLNYIDELRKLTEEIREKLA